MDSGIQSLPVEILEKIFQECVPPDEVEIMHPQLARLLQVCRRWNQSLLCQPSFWSYIRIEKPKRSSIILVELWLQRSGTTSPLSLMFHFYFRGDDSVAPKIIDLIVPQVHRWKIIDLKLSSRDPFNALCNLPRGSMPMLESASLFMPFWPEEAIFRVWNAIASAPLLSKAEISHISSPAVMSLPLPWHQLTAFETPGDIQCNHLLEILLRCKFLTRLIITFPEGPLPPNSTPITLPYLLYLGIYVMEHTALILSNLVAPKLDTFYITIADDISQEQYLSFEEFLGRSGCKLQSLIISNFDPQCQFLALFLRSRNLLHLEELEISNAYDHVLQAMTITDDSESLSAAIIRPSLRRINLEISGEMREGLLGSTLLSWVRAGSGLNDVRFAVLKQNHGYIQDLEVVEKVRELGIHVVIDTR